LALIDSNVLLDLLTENSVWQDWSAQALAYEEAQDVLIINDIVYAELAARFASVEALDDFVATARLSMQPIPRAALFMASKIHVDYRRAGGVRTGVLPDFFIGAHAAVLGVPIMTRDQGRYRTYFPTVELITPKIN
jgi:predicted nucleic acid-binding protein